MIPKILLQTCRENIPEYVQNMIKKRLSKDWEYIILNDSEQRQYLIDNPLAGYPNIVKKYDQLTGAHRSDLFRYYYTYINGGVFLDDDAMLYNFNLDEIIEDIDCFFAKGILFNTPAERKLADLPPIPQIVNAFYGVNKNNKIIKTALYDLYKVNPSKLATKKDNIKKYLRNVHILFKIVEEYNKEYKIKFFEEIIDISEYGNGIIIYKDKILYKHYHVHKIIPKNKFFSYLYTQTNP